MKKYTVVLLFAIAAFCSCQRRPKVIPPSVFAQITKEFIMTEAALSDVRDPRLTTDTIAFYEPILADYGYTIEDMTYSVEEYSKRKSAILTNIIKTAGEEVRAEADRVRELFRFMSDWNKMAVENSIDTVYRNDSLTRYTSLARLDKAVVELDVRPGEYTLWFKPWVDSSDNNFYYMYNTVFLGGDGERIVPNEYNNLTENIYRISKRATERMQKISITVPDTSVKKLRLVFFDKEKSSPKPLKKEVSVSVDSIMVVYQMLPKEASDTLFRKMAGFDLDVIGGMMQAARDTMKVNTPVPFRKESDDDGAPA